MSKDTIVGKIKEVSGRVRSAVGHATGDTQGEVRGNMDEAEGKVQKNYGKVKDIIKDTMND